jgi:hypothetical protein
MRSVFSVAVMLVVSATQAAPAPVWRERPSSKMPYEVMLGGLRKTGNATGPSTEGIWTLTVKKARGEHLEGVVLKILFEDGRHDLVFEARSARVVNKPSKKGVFTLILHELSFKGLLEGEATEKSVELTLPKP